MTSNLTKLEKFTDLINRRLNLLLPDPSEGVVCQAMRYSVENGGKRVRPVLSLAFCEYCGAEPELALDLACAVEMVHAYSLIHDDLPCMDDDDLRRGKPSCHIKFDQATALLAGDALLTLAFEIIMNSDLKPEISIESAKLMASAAGWRGMIGGQAMDLANEGKRVDLDTLTKTVNKKTGALIVAACKLGCLAAEAEEKDVLSAETYAANIGLAFQIIDDILDVTQPTEVLGKYAGSDTQNEKSTYVTAVGLEAAKEKADSLLKEAEKALEDTEKESAFLVWFAKLLSERKN